MISTCYLWPIACFTSGQTVFFFFETDHEIKELINIYNYDLVQIC